MSHARRSARFLSVTVPAVVALGLVTSTSPTWAEPAPQPSVGAQQPASPASPGAADTTTVGSFHYTPGNEAVHDEDIEVTRARQKVGDEVVPVTVTTVAITAAAAQTVRFRAPVRANLLAAVTLSGGVPVRSGSRTHRTVFIQQWVNGGWRTIGRTSARLTGAYQTRMRASGRPMLAKVRARVNRSAGKPAAVSKPRTIGFGSAAQIEQLKRMNTAQDWTWLMPGHDTWAKCRLTWAYEPAGGYAGAEGHAQAAVDSVDALTSFSFTKVAPAAHPDITIRWSNATKDSGLKGGTLGYGGVSATGEGEVVSAQVVLDQEETAVARKFNSLPMTWGSVMMHELTHGMGLSHALGQKQIMYPLSTSGTWGLGDRAGLTAVSRECAAG